jgi:hypothetical protein
VLCGQATTVAENVTGLHSMTQRTGKDGYRRDKEGVEWLRAIVGFWTELKKGNIRVRFDCLLVGSMKVDL